MVVFGYPAITAKLNSKISSDQQLLPKIQIILETLDGNQYFSILDQGKAHHKLHVSPQSRGFTAFITP